MPQEPWVTAHAVAQFEAVKYISAPPAGTTMCCELPVVFDACRLRVVLCERYAPEPILYQRAVLCVGGKNHTLTFSGHEAALMLPGQEAVSDAIEAMVRAGETLTLWLCHAGEEGARSVTVLPAQYSGKGDFCGEAFPPPAFFERRHAARQNACGYARLEAEPVSEACAVAAFGDSITSMGLWVNPLAKKITESGNVALLNMGIGGNRLLYDTSIPFLKNTQLFGRAALTRFSWDVAALPGVRAVFVALGVNDISQPGGKKRWSPNGAERCTTESLIAGFLKLLALCAEKDLKTVGCTITPFGGYLTYNDSTARIRNEANDWILNGGAFNMTVDFASAVCDPKKPDFMLSAFDSGDHLHPSPAGGQRMAEAVDLEALKALL